VQQLSQSLTENLSALDARFGQSADYYAKKIVLYGCPGCIVMFDGMASLDSLWELLLDAAGRQSASVRLTGTQAYAHILHGSAFPAESTPVQDMSQLVARLTAGMAVLLLEGCSSGIVFSVQGLKFRSVEEPSAEGNLRGSREGFTDLLRVNLSLLRRLVRTDTLMQEAAQAHTCCNTEYALCYCKDRADPAMVQRVRAILQSARPELLLDSSYFVPWLLPGKARLFTPVHYTERPAVAAAKLCEGKLVILVNGSPSALVLPALFSEQFECLDDYASTAVFSSFLRVLKYFSFYLTVFLPGVFVCVAVHLPELLPPQLLYKIEAAEKATPLPLFAEMLLVILLLEIIREAGLRMPQSLGHSVGAHHWRCRHCHRAYEHPGHLCGQHHGHCSLCHPGSVRACHPAAHRHGAVGRACRTSGTGSSVFRLFAQPRQHRSIGCAVSCAAPVPAAAAFRGRRSAPQLPAAVPARVQYLAKAGEGKTAVMKQQTERFTPAALTLSVVTAALADGIPQSVSVCRALWLGAVSAVCLCILSALAVAMLQNKAPSLAVRLALTAGLFMELVHTLVQAQGLCTAEFSSMALLGFLPLLLWAGWCIRPASWNASARVLWWFVAVGGVVCLLGLAGQLHWYRLFPPAQPAAAGWNVPVYAEYFAGALLCSARSARRTVWLPVWGFAVQAAALLGSALLFGSGTYPRLELLRAWSGGSFSRMDALLLLLWLLCAVYRAAMLCAAVRLLWQQPEAEVQP